jgi:hypothetical protein
MEHAVLAYALLWPTDGPARIAAQLRQARWGGCHVSGSGVYRILKRHGLQTRWERLTRLEMRAATDGLLTERTRRRLARPHVEAQRPGDLVCLDAFYIGKLTGVGKVWQLTACDVACSYGVATLIPRVTQQATMQFLRTQVVPTYHHAGHRVRAVLTDGRAEWQAGFTRACRALGIERRRTQQRHAWANGLIERLQVPSSPSCGAWLFVGHTTRASRSWSGSRPTCTSTTGSGRIRGTDCTAARQPRCSSPGRQAEIG